MDIPLVTVMAVMLRDIGLITSIPNTTVADKTSELEDQRTSTGIITLDMVAL